MLGYEGRVYRLRHEDGRFYIGSTKDSLAVRFGKHKINGLVKEFVDCWDKVIIELVEEVVCSSRKELQQREQAALDAADRALCVNKIRAMRRSRSEEHRETYARIKGTANDYYAAHRAANRERNRQYAREYYARNRERILAEARAAYHAKINPATDVDATPTQTSP